MDTKLKNYSKPVKAVSFILCVIAASITTYLAVALYLAYDMRWIVTNKRIIDNDISLLWICCVVSFMVALVTLVISIIIAGKRDEEGNIQLNWYQKIFTEFHLAVGFLAGLGAMGMCVIIADVLERTSYYGNWIDLIPKADGENPGYYYYYENSSNFEPYWLEIVASVVGIIACFSVGLYVILTIVDKIKGKHFWTHTLIGAFSCYVYEASKKSDDIFWKVMVTLIAACLISATWIGIIPVLILIFIFVPKWLRKYQDIKNGVNEVRNGNVQYKIPVEYTGSPGELDRLAIKINEISEATSLAVQNELKNQRMKTDLISNVSHDLRTPLTSMVTYIDLLKSEGLDSDSAPEYLQIIDEKTRRLQKLTEDLFEAAKASSGAIPVNMERIEMTSIVNQALGELEEKLKVSNLNVIFTPKTPENYVMADGQLLWRIIENLLINVSKYALPGSRVYLDITEVDKTMLLLEVKNMSKDSLNISEDELMERFKRGDESRNTEGSGLGLAIAKDLTALMNGSFSIKIDGDLFKASVALEKAE